MTSSSVAIRSPANSAPRRRPISRFRISANVSSAIVRGSPAIRMRSRSCVTTITPSAVSCTSSSITSAPASIALRKAFMLFSGAERDAPRCATTTICSFSSSRRVNPRAMKPIKIGTAVAIPALLHIKRTARASARASNPRSPAGSNGCGWPPPSR